ncbi:hypothetical protein BN439_1555 [Erwinia amylovora Ea644]|uniref:Uncharacterized protein n=3 Tax=Erwinia amylovora TaxID=552 RepID=A0A830ZUK8_ERWAM|nr:hypothetical protein EaACW_1233 [Erwinia amylovora ACW56400]QJQ55060.1 hypothetical protein EHX00_2358 [Erwinia amylovora]CBA20173.1 hypothetical protein predicted by Glimmer/Critica [Erwinia amylovora CFBP1430]CBX80078.1 hypothetical protein predicted by Glimmer/Critica [Erwinia amylovora ATCC BAA-2158]CCO78078.1 hypothetical protein BN432_1268 [Erwinia amylovora Ea356]CCO81865.1 hypothetical protein BN433_1281 [Erwinia amylovora Ea266]CCO85664.1 hypothetical protein BN434_1264 [Erwinia a
MTAQTTVHKVLIIADPNALKAVIIASIMRN